jgi:hypothetical protein
MLIVDGMPQRDETAVTLADVDEVLILPSQEAQVLYGARAAGGAIVVFTLTRRPR